MYRSNYDLNVSEITSISQYENESRYKPFAWVVVFDPKLKVGADVVGAPNDELPKLNDIVAN